MKYRYARYADQFVITRKSDGAKVVVPHRCLRDGKPTEYDLLWAQIERAERSQGHYLQAVLANWFEDGPVEETA